MARKGPSDCAAKQAAGYCPQLNADGFLSATIYLTMISTNQNNLEACISQAEAARIRGVSRQAIADLVRRGRLAKVNVAGRIFVLRSEIESFVDQPRSGRPPGKKSVKEASKKERP